jgi:hypothetical protein
MKQANNQQPTFQQSNKQSAGRINPSNSMLQLPHNSLYEIDISEHMGGREIETIFRPSHLMEVDVLVDYKSQNSNITFKPEPLENTIEDFLSLVEQQGFVDGYVNISHGQKVEERSGTEVDRNSYYFQDKSDGTVMTIEGEEITAESIRETSNKFIDQLHNNNLL